MHPLNVEKFVRYLDEFLAHAQEDLLTQARRGSLDDLRYRAGQLNAGLTIKEAFEQLRKEGSDGD